MIEDESGGLHRKAEVHKVSLGVLGGSVQGTGSFCGGGWGKGNICVCEGGVRTKKRAAWMNERMRKRGEVFLVGTFVKVEKHRNASGIIGGAPLGTNCPVLPCSLFHFPHESIGLRGPSRASEYQFPPLLLS